MRNNPFLQAEKDIIRRVYHNEASVNINVKSKSYDEDTGEITDNVITFKRNVFISNPQEISEAVVDKFNYIKGDLIAIVAYLELKHMFYPLNEDTDLITNHREFNGRTGGLDESSDTLEFGGITYRIISIRPRVFYCGTPTKYTIQLRAI